jgi:hypothetical protein
MLAFLLHKKKLVILLLPFPSGKGLADRSERARNVTTLQE